MCSSTGGELRDPPTQIWGKYRDPELSHPHGGVGGGGGLLDSHPPTKAVHKTRALDHFSEVPEIFEAYEAVYSLSSLSESHDESEELEQSEDSPSSFEDRSPFFLVPPPRIPETHHPHGSAGGGGGLDTHPPRIPRHPPPSRRPNTKDIPDAGPDGGGV